MKMYYYNGSPPNFGDELNCWLWPRLLPDFFNGQSDQIFLGIGSILFDFFPAASRKIVFGAGYGGYTAAPKMDKNWDVYFVRGPFTARTVGVDEALGIGDAAILVRSCIQARPAKQFKVSFMPHWESLNDGDWPAVCAEADVHLIKPSASVESVLQDILSSDVVVTEAMHGAIVADALRVPWVAVRPLPQHRLKWLDWASALHLDLRPMSLSPSTGLEAAISWLARGSKSSERVRRHGYFLKATWAPYFKEMAVRSLRRLSVQSPTLSSDTAIASAHERMLEQLSMLNRRYGKAA